MIETDDSCVLGAVGISRAHKLAWNSANLLQTVEVATTVLPLDDPRVVPELDLARGRRPKFLARATGPCIQAVDVDPHDLELLPFPWNTDEAH